MKILLFGATGMVGQGALLECLNDINVTQVTAIGRTPPPQQNLKLKFLAHTDFLNYESVADQLAEFDACLFCLGTTTSGKSEKEYTLITHDITLAAAKSLVVANAQMTFIYLSGAGAGQGLAMWARVRGQTEKELFALPFKAVFSFRPGLIQPLDGIKSKTDLYRRTYSLAAPLVSLSRAFFPKSVATTRSIGHAMVQVVRNGYPKQILQSEDFEALNS
jgi:uncharacterized protein YbjT (DUF2867 family)